MIDSGSFPAALRRGRRYQFMPSGYDSTYESSEGIIQYGVDRFNVTITDSLVLSSTTTATVTLPGDPGYKVGWIIVLYANFFEYGPHMLARVTAYDATDPYAVSMTFEAYQAKGSGTFDYWFIVPQWENAANYIQNPQYSALDLSDRNYLYNKAEFIWPTYGTTDTVVTSNTDTLKAGYTDLTYDGTITVEEDEYAINRPYVGITAGDSKVLTTTTYTTTYDYTSDPPIINTTTTEATETLTESYTYTDSDFDPSSTDYHPGAAAVYANGELVTFPTPSRCIKRVTLGGTYRYSSYEYHFEEFPAGSGQYRPTLTIDVSTSLGGATPTPISPADFFVAG